MSDQFLEKQPIVLIVDDNPINLRIFRHILSNQNYRITEANNGLDALDMVETIRPDLVLLDVMMPGIDGFEVCRIIKSQDKNANMPVIFLSARNDVADIVKGFESGAVDYLAKPFNKAELLARLKTHLDFKFTRDELIRTSIHLQELNELKNRLFSIIGHDLRSPLSNVKMTLDFILRKIIDPSSPDFHETIQELSKTTDEMFSLLENLFGWSRSQSGTLEIVPEKINISELVNSLLASFSPRIMGKEIVIDNQIDSSVTAWADSSMIKAVLKNLISNALKYSYRGGKIMLSANRLESEVEIIFTDFGVGIEPERLNMLFNASKQVRTFGTENETGSGIGLMLCKDFIEKSRGTISIESTIGQGSRFCFRLPVSE